MPRFEGKVFANPPRKQEGFQELSLGKGGWPRPTQHYWRHSLETSKE